MSEENYNLQTLVQEQDPLVRQKLIEERKHIYAFLESPAYRAGRAIVDEKYNNAIEFILDQDPGLPGAEAKLYQAIGEARVSRDWVKMYTDRLSEIETHLGPLTDEEK